jgi:hypothetical protein
MNPRESLNESIVPLGLLITASMCKEESTHGIYSIRRVTDAVVRQKQSTINAQRRA